MIFHFPSFVIYNKVTIFFTKKNMIISVGNYGHEENAIKRIHAQDFGNIFDYFTGSLFSFFPEISKDLRGQLYIIWNGNSFPFLLKVESSICLCGNHIGVFSGNHQRLLGISKFRISRTDEMNPIFIPNITVCGFHFFKVLLGYSNRSKSISPRWKSVVLKKSKDSSCFIRFVIHNSSRDQSQWKWVVPVDVCTWQRKQPACAAVGEVTGKQRLLRSFWQIQGWKKRLVLTVLTFK